MARMLFSPGSATLLFLEASDTKIIEQEHDFLSGLLETQKQAQKILMILILKQSLRQAECQQRKFESEITKAYEALNKANQALRKELMSLTANPPEGNCLMIK
jgi:arginine deiminase